MGCNASVIFPKPMMLNYNSESVKHLFPEINDYNSLKKYIYYTNKNRRRNNETLN